MSDTILIKELCDEISPGHAYRCPKTLRIEDIIKPNLNNDRIVDNHRVIKGIKVKPGYVLTKRGDIKYYKNYLLHRDDGPAVIKRNGREEWCRFGRLHRYDGPARVWSHNEEWYQFGKRHRLDGPAIEYANGDKYWYIDGKEYSFQKYLEKVSDEVKGKLISEVGKYI